MHSSSGTKSKIFEMKFQIISSERQTFYCKANAFTFFDSQNFINRNHRFFTKSKMFFFHWFTLKQILNLGRIKVYDFNFIKLTKNFHFYYFWIMISQIVFISIFFPFKGEYASCGGGHHWWLEKVNKINFKAYYIIIIEVSKIRCFTTCQIYNIG